MQKFIELPDGELINVNAIDCIRKQEDGTRDIHLSSSNKPCFHVTAEYFEREIRPRLVADDERPNAELVTVVRRLIEAIDRLKFSIPSSIRMHL